VIFLILKNNGIMYSTIKRKYCKEEGCNKMPQISCAGYCWEHCPEEIKSKFKSKRDLQIKKSNAAKSAATRLRGLQRELNGDSEQELWFKARREQMVNYCSECSRSTNKDNPVYYKWSVCHIVPKGLCPSVATNYYNWLELCQDCHNEFDSTFEKASKMKCFHEAKTKFQLFKHLIPMDEMRKVNSYLK
jgi:hypothetical protein